MKVVKLKLSSWEIHAIASIMWGARSTELHADLPNETIILAEYWPIWMKKVMTVDEHKVKTYTIALSLARILHHQLQQTQMSFANQSLLAKLDQELTNLSMKPKFPTISQ